MEGLTVNCSVAQLPSVIAKFLFLEGTLDCADFPKIVSFPKILLCIIQLLVRKLVHSAFGINLALFHLWQSGTMLKHKQVSDILWVILGFIIAYMRFGVLIDLHGIRVQSVKFRHNKVWFIVLVVWNLISNCFVRLQKKWKIL